MHSLNAAAMADQFVAERVEGAARARRFARGRRRFTRAARRDAPSAPLPGRLRVSSAGK